MTLPAPYYDHAGITIYHGDCRVILPELGKFDLLLTDPPYGHGAKWNGGGWISDPVYDELRVHRESSWDREPVSQDWIDRCVSSAAHSIIWGGNYYALTPSRCWLCWMKPDKAPTLADFELAWTSFDRPAKSWFGARNPNGNKSRAHPTQKPVALMRWCLGFFPEAKTVIDPYMGSGPVARACKDAGLRYVGVEIVEKYCEIAAKRLAQEVLFA